MNSSSNPTLVVDAAVIAWQVRIENSKGDDVNNKGSAERWLSLRTGGVLAVFDSATAAPLELAALAIMVYIRIPAVLSHL